ncbi:HD domain-containing protein [bacterium]|nr:HD domain-containing protein [bacterium]
MDQRFGDLIILLASGINQRRMYFDAHPRVLAMAREFVATVTPLLAGADGDNEFRFGVHNGKFIRDGRYLVGPSIAGRSLIEFAERLGCGGFVFRLPLGQDDLVAFFRLGAETKNPVGSADEAQRLFAARGLAHVELSPPLSESGEDGEGADAPAEAGNTPDFMAADFAPLLQVYQAMYETVAVNNRRAADGDAAIDLAAARSRGEELVAVSDQGALDVMQFMRYPDFDSYTIGHSVRVATLGALVARELGWPAPVQGEIATAGLLHDIGKGKVPDEILFKPGRLDDDERRIMESHPVTGCRVLLANGETSPTVLSATWGHHLRHDGGGYPDVPAWFVPGAAAALIRVCDVFEALTAVRPYKHPMAPRQAYEILLADPGAYHPRMLGALVRALGLYPPGSEVTLSDGRGAVVVGRGPDLEHPEVRVTHTATGSPIARDDQEAVSLAAVPGIVITGFQQVGLGGEAPAPEDDALAVLDFA